MNFANSAALRLTLTVAGVITLLSVLAMALHYHSTADALNDQQRALLAADVQAFAAFYDQRRIIALREAMDYRAATTPPETALYLLQGKTGEVLAGNIGAWPRDLPALAGEVSMDGAQIFTHEARPYLGVARVLPGGFPLLVARGQAQTLAVLTDLRQGIAGVALVLVAVGLAAGLVVSRLVLGRIDRLNSLADRVAEGDLAARLPGPRSNDEFGRLERQVHLMLDRIENLNRATLRLSDDIAHELRTPLNRILQKLDPAPGADAVRAEMRAAIRIFDSLLEISSAEAVAGTRPGLVPVDLSEVVAEVAGLYEPLAEDKRLVWNTDLAEDLWILGDRNLVAQLVSNLLDNAIKFCAPGDAIATTLAPGPGRHLLRVQDTGPGLPAEIGDMAFERFVRGARDRGVAGHGLGLALVQAIATRHGAKLECPVVEKGFAIVIAWPRVAAIRYLTDPL